MDLVACIERYDQAWNDQDVDAITSMPTLDMVFENHTRGVRVEGPAVRELLESTFADQPGMRFSGRRRYVGDDFVVSEWTATATDGDGLIARKDVYSSSHAPRVLDSWPPRSQPSRYGSGSTGCRAYDLAPPDRGTASPPDGPLLWTSRSDAAAVDVGWESLGARAS